MTNDDVAEKIFQVLMTDMGLADNPTNRTIFSAGAIFGFAIGSVKKQHLDNWQDARLAYERALHRHTVDYEKD